METYQERKGEMELQTESRRPSKPGGPEIPSALKEEALMYMETDELFRAHARFLFNN